MRIALTGATGHIGAALCRLLIERGFRPRVLAHQNRKGLPEENIEIVSGSVTDAEALDRLCKEAEIVFHLAGLISISGSKGGRVEEVNLGGTRAVAEACLRAGVRRLVHFSSVHAYEPPPFTKIFDETAPPVSASGFPYERSKSAAQEWILRAVQDRGLDAVILNPTSVLGPWDFGPSYQGKMLLDLWKGRLPAVPAGGFDWVDNRDVARAALNAVDKGLRGECYLLGGKYLSLKDLCETALGVAGRNASVREVPLGLLKGILPLVQAWARLSGRPPLFTREALSHIEKGHPAISHQKAAAALGYAPRPVEETLRDTWQWFSENMPGL